MKTAIQYVSELELFYTEDGMGLEPVLQGEAIVALIKRVLEDERKVIEGFVAWRKRFRAAKLMSKNMATMIDWPGEEKMQRASGQCECAMCGLPYFDHPHENGFVLTCDGSLLKL